MTQEKAKWDKIKTWWTVNSKDQEFYWCYIRIQNINDRRKFFYYDLQFSKNNKDIKIYPNFVYHSTKLQEKRANEYLTLLWRLYDYDPMYQLQEVIEDFDNDIAIDIANKKTIEEFKKNNNIQ